MVVKARVGVLHSGVILGEQVCKHDLNFDLKDVREVADRMSSNSLFCMLVVYE